MFWRQRNIFYRFIFVLILVSFISALVTFLFERDVNSDFDTITDMLFWWVATMTTVGAGGVPKTTEGEIFGIITMITAAVVYLAVFSEIIFYFKGKSDEKFVGSRKYEGENHVMIVGYNELAVGLINLLDRVLKPSIDIVLVSDQIAVNPNVERVTFVKRSVATTRTMVRVNAEKAAVAFVLSDDKLVAKRIDLNTILIAGMIEEIGSDAYTFAEITDERKKNKLEMFNIDNYFTYEDLLHDIREDANHSKLLKKLPREIKEQIFEEEFL